MQNLHDLAAQAARGAGKILTQYYKNDYEIQEKGYHNPVTTADHAADEYLRAFLMAETPEFGWLSEETVDSADRLDKEYVWVVDPLDGTKEFIEGVPHFVVSVGLVQNGVPLLGYLYNPVRDQMINSTPHGGVLINGNRTKMVTARRLSDVGCVNSRSETRKGLWEPWRETFRELVPIGSVAYKLGLVGAGEEDFFVTLRPKNEWDVCAGHAILKANGGILKDLLGNDVLYNKRTPLTEPGLVGGDPHLVDQFLAAYKEREGS
jgi:myo-inositol-1(or 4)-monophosphatase